MSYLSIYLNDHLGGATGGLELARRLRTSNAEDDVFGPPLDRLCAEIEADRKTLEQLIERLEISPSRVKPMGAWVMEKVGRLKPNGQLRGYSPLSRLLELETLGMGITGKLGLWQSLDELDIEQSGFDFKQLAARASEQVATVEQLHRIAAGRLGA